MTSLFLVIRLRKLYRILKLVFERFRQANLKLKPSKCSLFQHEVLLLGHTVSSEGIACDPSKTEAIKH